MQRRTDDAIHAGTVLPDLAAAQFHIAPVQTRAHQHHVDKRAQGGSTAILRRKLIRTKISRKARAGRCPHSVSHVASTMSRTTSGSGDADNATGKAGKQRGQFQSDLHAAKTIGYPCPMLNLILLEDEAVLRQELTEFLGDCGYRVSAVANLADFQACYAPTQHHIAVIDLGLPDGDGMELVRALRAQGRQLGIVVFTARSAMQHKVSGLIDGADYYLPKNTDLDELAATLSSLRRRLGEPVTVPTWILELGPRRLLPPGCCAIALSQQDLTVLQVLMAEPERIVSRQQIVESLGEDFLDYDQRRLDTQIRRLRRKTEQATGLSLPINTARNAGYRFFANAAVRP